MNDPQDLEFANLTAFLKKHNPVPPPAPAWELQKLMRHAGVYSEAEVATKTAARFNWRLFGIPALGLALSLVLGLMVLKPRIFRPKPPAVQLSPEAQEILYNAFFYDGDGSEEDIGI